MIVGKAVPWSKEDLTIIKEKGKDLSINEIIGLLSVKRTPKAVQHKLSKFGIYRKQKLINNYNSIKYKTIDGILHKLCKQCERYLPSTEDYFPTDSTLLKGIRNVCRECKGEQFRVNSDVEFWSDNEIDLMLMNYPHYSNPEMIDLFFNNRTISSLEHKAKELGLYKTENTKDRINKLNGKKVSKRKINNKDWVGNKNPKYNSQRFRELNPNYKGGITSLFSEMRRNITQWKIDSTKQCGFLCIFTGERFNHIHHLYSFNKIAQQTLNELGLISVYEDISLYTKEELKVIIDKCLEIHYRFPLGVCLTEDIHSIFHAEYGRYDNTPEQFYEFRDRYFNFEFDYLLNEKHKYKNIISKVS